MNKINSIISCGSTAFNQIKHTLAHYDWYQDFIKKKISRSDYLAQLQAHKYMLLQHGLNEDQIHLSTRFSLNQNATVEDILNDLYKRKVIASTDYPVDEFHAYFSFVEKKFLHLNYTTYIFPEEAQLLFALSHIIKPKRILFLGSYYGYWAIWAMPYLQQCQGEAYLIDVDRDVLALSQKNMKLFNYDYLIHYIHGDAIQYCEQEKQQHDLIVIDAEGPKEGSNKDLLDKAIYYPILSAADTCLSPQGMVLFHNILLDNPIKDIYFENKIAINYSQFDKLLPYIKANYKTYSWYDTTEGVGILRHKNLANSGEHDE